MAMPVFFSWGLEYSHLEQQLRSIALAILNDKVEIPSSPVAPGRFLASVTYAHSKDWGDLFLQNVACSHEDIHLGNWALSPGAPLMSGTLGTPDHSYPAGMECLTKIANVLTACGYEYEINTIEQFNSAYLVTELPDWCPATDYVPTTLVTPGYQLTTLPEGMFD